MKQIKLTKGFVAYVDEEDFERVSQFKWCAHITSRGTKVYAVRSTRKSEAGRWRSVNIRLHHFVLNISPPELGERVVHHKDDDGLNCCKENLEFITQEQNMLRSEGWTARWKKKPETPWL